MAITTVRYTKDFLLSFSSVSKKPKFTNEIEGVSYNIINQIKYNGKDYKKKDFRKNKHRIINIVVKDLTKSKLTGLLNKIDKNNMLYMTRRICNTIKFANDENIVDKMVSLFSYKILLEKYYSDLYADICQEIKINGNCDIEIREEFIIKLIENILDIISNINESSETFEEEKYKFINIIHFLGEMYIRNIVSLKQLKLTLNILKYEKGDIGIELICHLIFICGKNMENNEMIELDNLFDFLHEIIINGFCCKRIKFLLNDMFSLRNKGWVGNKHRSFENFAKKTYLDVTDIKTLVTLYINKKMTIIELEPSIIKLGIFTVFDNIFNEILDKSSKDRENFVELILFFYKKSPTHIFKNKIEKILKTVTDNINDIKIDIPYIEFYIEEITKKLNEGY